ncbi:MAG: hypothetical protein K1X78_07010 [Verrucomicrobiaceae bacterium]|nr:hypothetical protein [Verrucomicrobiaceae bacterium]
MDYFAAILFLFLYFVRLHDWVPYLSGLNVVKPAMILGGFGLLTRQRRTPGWKFMGTPHEWVLVAYLGFAVWMDLDWYGTFQDVFPLASFYFLTAYALNTEAKLAGFFNWWGFCVVFMGVVGALTVVGIDLTNAKDLIVAENGRLALNTYQMDNPNALGHTAVTGLVLIYMLLVFRRDVATRFLAIPLIMMVGLCVVSTQSKGAYLSGIAGLAGALLVGRKLWMQILVGCLLAGTLYIASSMLPRMVDRDQLRHDEGVMGRLLAFEAARTAYQTQPAGWKHFVATIKWQGQDETKATHSSYVQVGADLGPKGMFLYLSLLCCAFRSVITLRTDSDDLERCRRLIFALMVGLAVSGWMITRPYHAEYFLLAGAATAYHRLAVEHLKGIVPEFGVVEKMPEPDVPAAEDGKPVALAPQPEAEAQGAPVTPASPEPDAGEPQPARKFWTRYGFVDVATGYLALNFVVWFWDYIIENL